jgi:hypothetical protein
LISCSKRFGFEKNVIIGISSLSVVAVGYNQNKEWGRGAIRMVSEIKLTKKLYRNCVLRDLFFGSKTSLIILLLYGMWWRVLYTITKIGQLKTNIPIFLGISFLLLVTFIHNFIVYRRHMKKDLSFQVEVNETHAVKTIHQTFWKWSVMFFSLFTLVGVYYVGSNAVNFNGALTWKIFELRTEDTIKLENDNFYTSKLDGILDSVNAKMKLEPYLMTNDIEIEFKQDGTITEIYTFIYGFDQNQKLQSGYLIYTKGNKIKLHKQDWNGQGTEVYNPNNDLSIVVNMLKSIPIKEEVKRWNEETNAILYKGIRTWRSPEGIRMIDENGEIYIPSMADSETGPTISLYVPGKEDTIIPQRYIYEQFYRGEDFPI